MEHLLFIDDERYFARQYAQELEKEYRVTICRSAENGIALLKTTADTCALVLDIQMPTPRNVPEYETKDGVDTGLWLLRTCREWLVDRRLPILILTNRREGEISACVQPLHFPNGQIEIFYKPDVSPHTFSKMVTSKVLRWANTRKKFDDASPNIN